MTPYVGNGWRVLVGDAVASLSTLADGSARCCVTSPPYWGLRDYGVDGQIGMEPTPDAYAARLVEVFREVRRVLADDGTLWLNIGDTYASSGGHTDTGCSDRRADYRIGRRPEHDDRSKRPVAPAGIKPKDLVGVPWLLAFALRADGWYLRSDIIWHKPNPMPESVTDRPTKGHEYLFLLSKREHYYYDAGGVAEDTTDPEYRSVGKVRPGTDPLYVATGDGGSGRYRTGLGAQPGGRLTRNRRTVWTIATEPYPGAHFAVMPTELVRPCILAGSATGDAVIDPFSGAGTVGVVARRLGRLYAGCELNPEYAALSAHRISEDQPLLNRAAS